MRLCAFALAPPYDLMNFTDLIDLMDYSILQWV